MKLLTTFIFGTAITSCTGLGVRYTDEYISNNKESLWRAFKTSHEKMYDTPETEAVKKDVFVKNMKAHAELQKENPHATFGYNRFSDMTDDEFIAHHTGYKPAADSGLLRADNEQSTDNARFQRFTEDELKSVASEINLKANLKASSNPTAPCQSDSISLNWALTGVCGHVKDQGSCGGCWAFSTTGSIESQWAIRGHPQVSLSEQELISCATTCDGCGGGQMYSAFDWILASNNGGVATEASYPYAEESWSSASGVVANQCMTEAQLKVLPTGASITRYAKYPIHEEAQMYMALKTHGPLSIAVDATSWKSYHSGILTSCIEVRVNHAVLLVGHGYDEQTQQEYWVVKNSWGSNWGENGYIRLQYGVNMCLIANEAPTSPFVEDAAPTPGITPLYATPDGAESTPAVLDHEIVDPMKEAPLSLDKLIVCVAGRDCDCKDVCHFPLPMIQQKKTLNRCPGSPARQVTPASRSSYGPLWLALQLLSLVPSVAAVSPPRECPRTKFAVPCSNISATPRPGVQDPTLFTQ